MSTCEPHNNEGVDTCHSPWLEQQPVAAAWPETPHVHPCEEASQARQAGEDHLARRTEVQVDGVAAAAPMADVGNQAQVGVSALARAKY